MYVVLCILPFEKAVSPLFDYFTYIKYSVNKEIRIFKGFLPCSLKAGFLRSEFMLLLAERYGRQCRKQRFTG